MTETDRFTDRDIACPCCRGQWNALAWSKAGMTYLLCEEHKEAARSQRRLKAEFARVRRLMFTGVKMDERRSGGSAGEEQ